MRGFSDEERERIRRELLAAGRKLFAQHGLQKTTIEDLTDDVDIGTSTFYQFYDSKEELYIAVLEDTGEDVIRRMNEANLTEIDDPKEAVEELLQFVVTEIDRNPLARQITVDPDTRRRLAEYQSADERANNHQSDIQFIRMVVDSFVENGQFRSQDPDLIAEAIAAIPYLTLHRDEIGGGDADQVIDFIIETFASGLVADD